MLLRLLLVLLIMLLPIPAVAAVTHEGTDVTGACNFCGLTLTLTGKTTSGSDRCEMVAIGWDGTANITSVTSNGVAMIEVIKRTELGTPAGDLNAALYRSDSAPATGAHNIVITVDDDLRIMAGVSSYNGCDLAGTFNTNSGTGTGSGPSVTQSTGVTADTMVVDAAHVDDVYTVGANQTQFVNQINTVGGDYYVLGSYQDGADGGAMTWSGTSSWVSVTANIPATGGGGAPACRGGLLLLGVGGC